MQLLIEELNHRVKNTLMVVQGLAHQSFRGKDVPAQPLATFGDRLNALAGAHTALSKANWGSAPVDEVIRQGIAVFRHDADRVTISGPSLRLASGPTVPLVLALHELATNALKYGALSGDAGKVEIRWSIPQEGWIELLWTERGGPPVAPPQRQGFGSRLITDAVSRQLGGTARIDHAPEGVTCRIAFPVERQTA